MHHESESVTISLDRPRKLILFVLFVVYGVACVVVSFALADLALIAVSRYA